MRISFAGILADAWALFRHDRDLLLRIALPFMFLPAYALTLLVPPMPLPDVDIADAQQRAEAWMPAVQRWIDGYGLGFVAAFLIVYFGAAVLTVLYCDPARPDLRGALTRALRLYPRYLLAVVVVALPAGLGAFWPLAIPALYLVGRLLVTAPVLVTEAPVSAWQAVRRSMALTRSNGLAMMGLTVLVYLTAMFAGQPLMLLDGWLRTQGGGNPIAVALVDAGAAAVAMAVQLASSLFAIAAYRRLAR